MLDYLTYELFLSSNNHINIVYCYISDRKEHYDDTQSKEPILTKPKNKRSAVGKEAFSTQLIQGQCRKVMPGTTHLSLSIDLIEKGSIFPHQYEILDIR